MEKLQLFFASHPLLCMAFVGLLGALFWTFVSGRNVGVKKASPTEMTRLINQEDALVVDVRSDGEFRQGHVLNAINVPQNFVDDHLEKLEKHRDKPLITMCKTGQISPRVGATLHKHGFTKVYTLVGGLLAWKEANLPVTKKK